ncbi:LysE family translocator [Enterobacillus tribolii]|uniref:Threonine/homoserine/homoserine lactone efflux protein n=1 Tax=Enterobacillus tribolii TaxID=1487935 RepID=A0A370QTP8_9GAMM|nr:LysE family translocator [Enterobacillus tribolii]MBW7981313.1 LysE family translocator [Enterobacillus tribolii]RDK92626.1 threonine/homoserine/homoserine lactone efflux protein [Enterobacillus tribolii]
MELGLFFSMLGFLWVAAITPGPNNMLLTSSGANFGFTRSVPLMFGIMLGMQSLLLLVAFGVGGLLVVYPSLHTTLKVLGSAYLLYIAWKIATSSYERLDPAAVKVGKPVYWYQGWLLQFLNPKAWLMGLGAITSFSLAGERYNYSVLAISVGMFLVNLVAGIVWLGFGTLIGRLLRSRRAWFTFNISMGLLTAACVLLIWH